MTNIKQLVREAKRKRLNRAYYDSYFFVKGLREAGFIQDEEKSLMERVQLDHDLNELLYLFGFDHSQRQSQFNLRLSVVSLYPQGLAETRGEESRWRLANINFKLVLLDPTSGESTTFSYGHEQLIDYEEKRGDEMKHEHCSVYKVGSMSIEQVSPFSFARVLFNGLLEVRRPDGSVSHEPMRLSISTHPTSDKLDYTYRFSVQHTTDIIKKSLKDGEDKHRLLDLALENRFDQPLMFQGHLESLAGDEKRLDEKFVFWGAKVKEFLNVQKELATADDRDCLFAWTEAGQQIHLSRPLKKPNLVYGLIHNSFDYSSHLYEAKLFRIELGEEKEVDFSELESFSELASNYKIKLRGFKAKWYTIEISQNDFKLSSEATFKVKLNGFDGLAMRTSLGLVSPIRAAQSKLLTLTIGDPHYGFLLADERLLGGKGNSLINLSRSVLCKQLSTTQFSRDPRESVQVSVPRGLVLTTQAYKLWLDSNPKIAQAIEELDLVRRNLAAKSVYLNPMSEEYVSLSDRHRILGDTCERTSALLKQMPLPNQLKNQVYNELVRIFGKDQLDEKGGQLFAVRSSAVGEDSLETSAAGQMKTILDARGFQTICQAIVDCWASQFEIEPATYKSQNGLTFNLPMAVVVQELVPCYVAGVATTCDPLNGNKKRLEISANFGLGEGVVSGKKTDTVRVSLDKLGWHDQLEDHVGQLYLADHKDQIEFPAGSEDCCLANEHIVALANLLLEVRRSSVFKEREVEWGITTDTQGAPSSGSSSSSSSTSSSGSRFRVHLLQSRPLTHLQRLTTNEIEHELDYGLPCARDLVSRANLGEVMPGALCPLNSSFSQPISGSYVTTKPYEPNQSRKLFVADSAAFYAQMMVMVSTYSDTLRQVALRSPDEQETTKKLIYYMIGVTYDEPKTEEEREWGRRFMMDKIHPLAGDSIFNPRRLALLQLGLHSTQMKLIKRRLRREVLQQDLPSFKQLESNKNLTMNEIHGQLQLLYKRITSEIENFCLCWVSHIQSTMLNITINFICLKLLSNQEAYAGEANLVNTETLNDFSALMRPSYEEVQKLGKKTESGDISRLLELLLMCLVEENLLNRAKEMQPAELHNFFTDEKSQLKCCKLYRDFMKRNGHRAFREFCLSTITWSDDSSYIMRLLAMRLKTYTPEEQAKQDAKRAEMEREHEAKRREIEAKITSLKTPLKWAFSQARESTTRRESTKSLLIKAVHKYRLAFRHLGGLLCLAGLLPSADLIFWLSIEELDDVIKCCSANESGQRDSLMPRLLYKARRRQQRARVFDQVKFPKPTLTLNEMFQTIREQSELAPVGSATNEVRGQSGEEIEESSKRVQVSGLISCAGRVTGRACVITSIDQMDQVQQGDILITYSIDTSWTVYFFALAGIVTELGGIVSHGAVVAREYGIPTLCTAIDACRKFKTGQMVTLDANAGTCYLAEGSANIDNGAANIETTAN